MYPHHLQALDRVTASFSADPNVLGILLVGSIAHGFAREDSDVDIMLVVPDAQYAERAKAGTLTAVDFELCSYDGGYIDIKYVCPDLMARVGTDGSEPARFAFEGAQMAFSRDTRIAQLLAPIARYPVERKADNLRRFFAQLKAWRWYCDEALRHDNRYLLSRAVNNLVLFGGRLVLAQNETLYPSHKWFMRVLSEVEHKPEGVMAMIAELLASPEAGAISRFYDAICGFADWPDGNWSHQFVMDSELNWTTGHTPVEDL